MKIERELMRGAGPVAVGSLNGPSGTTLTWTWSGSGGGTVEDFDDDVFVSSTLDLSLSVTIPPGYFRFCRDTTEVAL